jgi:GPH family glycoside/pentoside/hexuronide:cation symporter
MSTPAPAPIRSEDRVPWREKLAYGAAASSGGWAEYATQALINPIFVVLMHVSPTTVSLAQLIFRLWDAFTDVFVGSLSDNARTRWGRRRPFIFVGALLTGLWMPCMWLFGRDWSGTALVVWFIGAWLVFYLFQTIWNVPYQSLLLEMTPDTHERTNVAAVRGYFGKAAVVMTGWVWFLTQLPLFHDAEGAPDTLLGARWVIAVVGALVVVAGVLPAFFITERFYKRAAAQAKIPIRESLRLTFRNRPFVLLAIFTLLFALGSQTVAGLGFYTKLYYVCGGDQKLASLLDGITGTATLITGFAGIPLFQWIARRWGKERGLAIAMAVTLLSSLSTWLTFNPAFPYLSLVNGILLAPAATGMWVIIPSMTGDVADYDELHTGERREGAFAAIYSWVLKLAFSVGIGLSGPLVELAGFRAGAVAPLAPEVLLKMRLLLAFVPVLFLGAAICVLLRYPLTPKRITEVRAMLEARRGKL